MKIAILANHNAPVIKKEGTLHNIVFCLIQSLMHEGNSVTLYALEGSVVPCSLVPLDQVKNHSKMFYEDKNEEDYMIQNINYSIAFQSIEKGNYDLVHSFNQHYLSIALGNASDKPFVTTLSKSPTGRLERFLGLQNCIKTDFVFTSEALKSNFKQLLKAEVIYNGLEVEPSSSVKRKNVIAWDGKIEDNTGLESLIQLAQVNAFKILLMGPIEDMEYYEASIAPEIKKGIVKYVGNISNEMKGDIFNSCKIYMYAHKQEVFNYYTILKAMASGTPVLTWDYGVMRELIQPENGTLCALGDFNEMNESVIHTLQLHEKQQPVSVPETFTIQRTVELYVALYKKLTA